MTLTRWKLCAGLLGLSLAGLAATADPPCPGRNLAFGCTNTAPTQVVTPQPVPVVPASNAVLLVAMQPPVVVPPPKIESPRLPDVKIDLPAPSLPPPLVLTPDPPKPTPEPKIALPPPAVVQNPLPIPSVSGPLGSFTATSDVILPPVSKPLEATIPPLPVKLDPPKLAVPDPALAKPIDVKLPNPVPPIPDPAPLARPEATPTPAATTESPVKVVIRLGVGQPRFDVQRGDDTLLKVVCESLDVKTPGDKSRPMSALKAGGAVRFTATWCEGTCNELAVLADTGEVVLTGDVRVRTKKAEGETVIVASQMTFKLGAAPAYTVADPATGTVTTASFRQK